MKKITMRIITVCAVFAFTFSAIAQNTSAQFSNNVNVSFEMQAQIQEALSRQPITNSQTSNRAPMAATYVGSFNTNDGPNWGTNPPVLSAVQAAALIFGGSPSDYVISTNPNTTDPLTITNTAWATTWGVGGCQEVAEDYFLDLGAPGYNDPGGTSTAISAYVDDNCTSGNTNYVWLVDPAPSITCPGDITVSNDTGICGAVVNYTVTATSGSSTIPPLNGFANFTKLGTYNGHTYYQSEIPMNAAAVFADALSKGGYVATINDAAENAFINNAILAGGFPYYAYIGLNDVSVEGSYVWQNGDPVTYTNWAPGEPNDSGGEDYVIMYSTGLWNDVQASHNDYYVLEIDATFEQTAGLPSGSVFPVGVTTNTFEVTDSSGNTSSCSFDVTVNDTEAPVITCPGDVSVSNDPGVCGAVVNYTVTATDNCSSSGSCTTEDFEAYALPAGSAENLFGITILDETTIANGQGPGLVQDGCVYISMGGDFQWNDAGYYGQVNRNIVASSNTIKLEYDTTVGVVNFNLSAFDGYSDTATIEAFDSGGVSLGVVGPLAIPNATPVPVSFTVPGIKTITIVGTLVWSPLLNDHVFCTDSGSMPPVQTAGLPSGSTFPVGTTTNTFVATDDAGNTSTCSFDVTVNDTEAPVITCVPDTTKNTDPGVCQYTVVGTEFDATFTDNCTSGTITNDFNTTATLAGAVLPKGVTTVVWTVNDGHGQTATCTTVITVEDNEAPAITCVPNATRNTDPGVCEYTIVGVELDATFTDNCADGNITNDFNGTDTLAGETLPTGNTTVVWTVNDGNGQTATCTTVIMVEDNEAPIIACPADITANTSAGDCFATVSFTMPYTQDNCGIDTVVQTMGDPSGSQFPVGTTTIEFTATDVNGNVSTCSFTITVTDNEAPVAVCQNITIQLDASGNASITAADVDGGSTDQCGVASISIDMDTFDCSNVGDNNVTLTVTDVNGNTSTCIAIVTVEDVTAPVVACQNITVELDPITGTATIAGIDIDNGSTDTCGIASYDLDIDTFDCSNIGDNTVVLTVTDVNGNTETCTAIVTVEDNTGPVLVCQDFTLELGADGTATLDPSDVIASNDDACGIYTVAVDITQFSCADIGTPVTVQVFTQDNNGNLATCTATVTVVDNLAPVVTCPADQTVDPGVGNLFYILPDYFATGEATAVDNCTDPVTITTQNPAPGTPLADGTYTITLTATDEYGNTGTCEFELIVESVLGTGNNSQNLGSIAMYPNPAKSEVTIGNPQSLELESANIYDLTGRLVQSFNLKGMATTKTLNVDSLAAATYVVIIQGKQGQITKRLLKE